MKVIFLDFDGVILTMRTQAAARADAGKRVSWSAPAPDPLLCSVLRACGRAGASIVLSTSWRDMGDACTEKVNAAGISGMLHTDWRTTLQSSPGLASDRPWQIAEWMKRHPEVKSYRILDDEDWHWSGDQKQRFIKCHPEDGMGGRDMHRLLSWALGEAEEAAA